jgi:hypothetical protein
MNRYDYEKEAITELVTRIQKQGLKVYLAEKGTYGFYTNSEGSRLVSFQCCLGGLSFSGNYITDAPKMCGQGWQISDTDTGDYKGMLNAHAPQWAVGQAKSVKYKTVEDHLNIYGKSSKYKEQGQ